jgi:hypothetical protein
MGMVLVLSRIGRVTAARRKAQCAKGDRMMRHLGIGLLWAIAGYLAAAFVCYLLIMQFSPNVHDRSLEAGMTGAFVLGPAGAVVAFVIGVVWSRRRPGVTDKTP